MKGTIEFVIFYSLVLGTSSGEKKIKCSVLALPLNYCLFSELITGDVDTAKILSVYYESYQWVSVCSITESTAHTVCRQLGRVQAKAINSTFKK